MGTRIPVHIAGNLVADPEISFGSTGVAHSRMRVAVNQRIQNPDGTWRTGEPVFHNVSAFRNLAENSVDSLKRGDPVVVSGELEFGYYEKDGVQREAHRVLASSIGPDLRYGKASYERTPRVGAEATASAQGPAQPEPGVTHQNWGTPQTGPVTVPPMPGSTPDVSA